MQDAYAERRSKLGEAQALLDGIDGFVFNQLNIHPESVVEATRFKKTISEILHGRFDVEYNMGFHKFDPYGDQVRPVQDVASFPSETRDPTQKPDIHFSYISVNLSNGCVILSGCMRRISGVEPQILRQKTASE